MLVKKHTVLVAQIYTEYGHMREKLWEGKAVDELTVWKEFDFASPQNRSGFVVCLGLLIN